MRIAAGFTARRTPGWPLAVTLGVHVLLLWAWRVATAPQAPTADPLERTLMLVPAPMPRILPDLVRPARPKPPATRTQAAPATAPEAATPIAAQPDAEPISEPDVDPLAQPSEQATVQEGIKERARQAAGPAAHALRKGKLAKLEPGDTPLSRFRTALEGAHKDSRRTLASESYTTPDGVTIYRFRIGGKVYCRTGGHVKPGIGGAEGGGATLFDSGGGGGAAGIISCPKHAEFTRD